jgi:hypothetical protein
MSSWNSSKEELKTNLKFKSLFVIHNYFILYASTRCSKKSTLAVYVRSFIWEYEENAISLMSSFTRLGRMVDEAC